MNELTIEAKIENLDTVVDFITEKLSEIDYPMNIQMEIAVAAEEIFVNIAHYAYSPETGDVVIRFSVEDQIIIEFEDKGKPYNPLDKEDPDITLDIDKREIGGLGIFMVKNMMDSVEYRRKDNRNLLVLRKAIV